MPVRQLHSQRNNIAADNDHAPVDGRWHNISDSERLYLQLIGSFKVNFGTKSISIKSRRARAILGYVAVSPEGLASRSHIADLLWDRVAEDQARTSLRQAVSELKCALQNEAYRVLITEREVIGLDLSRCNVDIRAASWADLCDCLDLEALGNGDAIMRDLFGISAAFDQWIIGERSKFVRHIRAELENRLSQASATVGAFDRQIEASRALLTFDPSHEGACRVLMSSLFKIGERAQALREYDLLCKSLKEQLDLKPSSQTRALFEAIKAAECEKPSVSSLEAPSVVRSSTPSQESPIEKHPSLMRRVAIVPIRVFSDDIVHRRIADLIYEDLVTDVTLLAGPFEIVDLASHFGRAIEVNPNAHHCQFAIGSSLEIQSDNIRLTIRVLDSINRTCIWVDRCVFKPDGLFEINTSVTSRLAREIQLALIREESRRIYDSNLGPQSTEDFIVQGYAILRAKNDPKDLEEAYRMFSCALAVQPYNVDALSGFAHVCQRMASQPSCGRSTQHVAAWGRAAIDSAIALDPRNVYANHVAGMLRSLHGEVDLAAEAFEAATSRSNYAPAHAFAGYNEIFRGNANHGIKLIEHAISRSASDPSSSIYSFFAGAAEMHCQHLDQAIFWLTRSLSERPLYGSPHVWLAGTLMLSGRRSDAVEAMRTFRERHPTYNLPQFMTHWGNRSGNHTYQQALHQMIAALQQLGLPES